MSRILAVKISMGFRVILFYFLFYLVLFIIVFWKFETFRRYELLLIKLLIEGEF